MQLLERDAALASLAEYAAEAGAGDPRFVLLAGEAGVGKTSLVDALARRLPEARWLWGRCDGSFTPEPLAPLYDIATALGGPLLAAWHDDIDSHPLFRTLLDELPATLGPPTVIVFEDVHWADDATLDLLRFLGSRLRNGNTLVVATYRDDGLAADHPLRVTLGELASQRSTRRISLASLSRDAVAQLAVGTSIAAGELHALTGGNPFLVNEVLDAGVADIPASARDAVLARVARLSTEAREALEAAAIIGMRVEVDVLERASGATHAAIDECLTAGALVSDGASFRFRHEIARRALEASIAAHRLADLHRRTFVALVATGCTDDARLAHHADGAGDADAVVHHAVPAAERASARAAHREAALQYHRALGYADGLEPRRRAELYDALAIEHTLTDTWEDAAETQQAALALWRELGDRLREGESLRQLSRTMFRLCRGDDAAQAAADAVAVLRELPPSAELGWALSTLAAWCWDRPDAPGPALNDEAIALARQLEDPVLLAACLNSRGVMSVQFGGDGVADLREAIAMAERAGHDEQTGRGYTNLVDALVATQRYVEAEAVYRTGIAFADEHDLGTYGNCMRGGFGRALERLGRWDELDALLTFDLLHRQLSPINKLGPLWLVGLTRARRGRVEDVAMIDESIALSEEAGEPFYILEASVARLEAAWLMGDTDRAHVEEERARDVYARGSCDPVTRGGLMTLLRRVGQPTMDEEQASAPHRAHLVGDWRAAADAWLELGCPYDAGLALLDSGDVEAVREAIALFDKLGAVATIAVAQAELRRLGETAIPRGRRASTRDDRWGLTRREREVLALIGDGCTNADIAGRLFIAEKTVDNHVASVLAKMGVTSRRDAARLAESAEDVVPAAIQALAAR
jgi:DNA-binding CsgD family transcriptional regulator